MALTGNQLLAHNTAIRRGVYPVIVMSTIEAESNFRNILGQYAAPSARWGGGFGQVHVAWHVEATRKIANELNITLPADFQTVPFDPGNQVWDLFARGDRRAIAARYVLDNIVLRNDVMSMNLAVEIIGRKWRASGGDFNRFTRAYVGAGIPSHDLERRRLIHQRWINFYRTTPAPAPPAPERPGTGRREEAYIITGIEPEQWAAFAGYFIIFIVFVKVVKAIGNLRTA